MHLLPQITHSLVISNPLIDRAVYFDSYNKMERVAILLCLSVYAFAVQPKTLLEQWHTSTPAPQEGQEPDLTQLEQPIALKPRPVLKRH